MTVKHRLIIKIICIVICVFIWIYINISPGSLEICYSDYILYVALGNSMSFSRWHVHKRHYKRVHFCKSSSSPISPSMSPSLSGKAPSHACRESSSPGPEEPMAPPPSLHGSDPPSLALLTPAPAFLPPSIPAWTITHLALPAPSVSRLHLGRTSPRLLYGLEGHLLLSGPPTLQQQTTLPPSSVDNHELFYCDLCSAGPGGLSSKFTTRKP